MIVIIIVYSFSNIRILSMVSQLLFVLAMGMKGLLKSKIRLTVHFVWMGIFILLALISTLFAYDPSVSFTTVINLSLKLMFYTTIIMYIKMEEEFHWFLHTLIVAGVILTIRLLIATPLTVWGTERVGEVLELNSNTIGLVLSYASISAIYLGKKLNVRKYYLVLIPFIVITLLTGSRKAFLIISIGIVLLLFLYSKKRKDKIIAIVVGIIFIWGLYEAAMSIPYLYEIIGKRFKGLNIISGNINASTRTRMIMIQEAWQLFKNRPLIGYGLENFRLLSVFQTYSHNNYLEILFSTGILGFLAYYSLPLSFLFLSFRKMRKNSNYVIIVVFLSLILTMDIALVSYKHLITQIIIVACISQYSNLRFKEYRNNHQEEKQFIEIRSEMVNHEL